MRRMTDSVKKRVRFLVSPVNDEISGIRNPCKDGVLIDAGYRVDLLVEGKVIVELKAVEKLIPIFEAQLLTYLKLSRLKVGLLINFNVLHLKDRITRLMI